MLYIFFLGSDLTGVISTEVLLDGDDLVFSWTISSTGGANIILLNEATPTPRVIVDAPSIVELTLTVSDGCDSNSDVVELTIDY